MANLCFVYHLPDPQKAQHGRCQQGMPWGALTGGGGGGAGAGRHCQNHSEWRLHRAPAPHWTPSQVPSRARSGALLRPPHWSYSASVPAEGLPALRRGFRGLFSKKTPEPRL